MKRGYIKIFRKLFEDHEFWKEKRVFSKAEAWIDILRSARWKDEPETLIDKRGSYVLELGDFYISERFLCQRWSWSRTKVRAYLGYLIKKESISYKIKTTHRTIITVINLKGYLGWETTRKTSDQTSEVPVKDQRSTSEVPKKKKVKKEKKGKPNNIIPDWMPTEAWNNYVDMRNGLKPKPTEHALDLLIIKLGKFREAGDDPEQVLNNSIMNSWKGIFPLKENNGQGTTRHSDIGGVRPEKGKYDHLG